MKIYAVRDRLLDYYGDPFMGPTDNSVLAAMASNINNPESKRDFAQAPHHFEIWRLGEINENGDVTKDKELLCDCASLIRPGIRLATEAGTDQNARPARSSQGEARNGLQPERTSNAPASSTTPKGGLQDG